MLTNTYELQDVAWKEDRDLWHFLKFVAKEDLALELAPDRGLW